MIKTIMIISLSAFVYMCNIANAQTQFIKYKDYLIPIDTGIQTDDELTVCGTQLCTKSGKVVFLRGFKWFARFTEEDIGGERFSDIYYSESEVKQVINWASQTGLNYILFKTSYWVAKDRPSSYQATDFSTDAHYHIDRINELKRLVEYARLKNVYVQISIFDTWARENGKETYTEDPNKQVLNVWSENIQHKRRARNYLKYIVTAFKDYPNVFFELGNELEHSPNHGIDIGANLNALLSEYYTLTDANRPISISEEKYWQTTSVNLLAQHNGTPKDPLNYGKPIFYNELVFGQCCGAQPFTSGPNYAYARIIRDPNYVNDYQLINTAIRDSGQSGTICGATWLDIGDVISSQVNQSIKDVYTHCANLHIE